MTDPVTSPRSRSGSCTAGRVPVSHVDLFRLETLAGEDPALLADYLTPDRVAFIEWPGAGVAEVEPRAGGAASCSSRTSAATGGGSRPAGTRDCVECHAGRPSSRDADRVRHLDGRHGRVRDPAVGRAGPHARRPTRSGCSAPPAHSAELLPALAGLLERAGTGWDEVTAIAVGVGPGTFTGLRIGVATARGLGQALGVPLHPVSSLEALAAGIAAGAGRRARHADPAR